MPKRTAEEIAAYKKTHREAQKAADPEGFAEKHRLRRKAWREANPERAAAFQKKWRDENPEKYKAQQAEYRKKNREKLNARARAYAAANRERLKARRAELNAADPEARRTREKQRRYRNPAHTLLMAAKRNAAKKNLPFNLDITDIVVPTHCPVYGFELKRGERNFCDTSPSVDKIVPELGYVKGNVAVVSWKANRLKNNATAADLVTLANFYASLTTTPNPHQ